MSKLNFAILSALILATATPAVASQKSQIEILCNQVHESQRTGNLPAAIQMPGFWDLLDLMINPASAVGVLELRNGALVELADAVDENSESKLPVILFSPDKSNLPSSKDELYYEYDRYLLQKFRRTIGQKIISSRSVDECITVLNSIRQSEREILQTETTTRDFLQLRDKKIAKKTEQEILDSKKLESRIQVVEISDYTDILEDLKKMDSNKAKLNLLLVLHGSQEGALQDLGGLTLPPSFFSDLSRLNNIASISIYACFPESIVKFYKSDLDRLTENGVKIFLGESQGPLKDLKPVDVGELKYFIQKLVAHLD